jgi:hypothetical protein
MQKALPTADGFAKNRLRDGISRADPTACSRFRWKPNNRRDHVGGTGTRTMFVFVHKGVRIRGDSDSILSRGAKRTSRPRGYELDGANDVEA